MNKGVEKSCDETERENTIKIIGERIEEEKRNEEFIFKRTFFYFKVKFREADCCHKFIVLAV